jgi:hypothetical protein
MTALRTIWILVLLAGCTGSSVPQPPNLDPINPRLVFDEAPEGTGDIELIGDPGAAPGLAEVWAWDLDSDLPPAVVSTNERGEFRLVLAEGTREARFQVRRDGARSRPLDASIGLPLVELERPACFVVPLEVDLGAARIGEIAIRNDCAGDVTLDFALRYGEPDLVVNATPSLLPSGAEIFVSVRALGSATIEDILFVFATIDASTVRYPVSLLVRGGT